VAASGAEPITENRGDLSIGRKVTTNDLVIGILAIFSPDYPLIPIYWTLSIQSVTVLLYLEDTLRELKPISFVALLAPGTIGIATKGGG